MTWVPKKKIRFTLWYNVNLITDLNNRTHPISSFSRWEIKSTEMKWPAQTHKLVDVTTHRLSDIQISVFFPAYSSPAIKLVNTSTESQEMSTGLIADRILGSMLDHTWKNALPKSGTQNYSLKDKWGTTKKGIIPKGHICNPKLLLRSLSNRLGGFCLHMTETTFSSLKKIILEKVLAGIENAQSYLRSRSRNCIFRKTRIMIPNVSLDTIYFYFNFPPLKKIKSESIQAVKHFEALLIFMQQAFISVVFFSTSVPLFLKEKILSSSCCTIR